MRRVLILGSTGSIGTQALDVVRANPGRFDVVGLAAGSDRVGVEAPAHMQGTSLFSKPLRLRSSFDHAQDDRRSGQAPRRR